MLQGSMGFLERLKRSAQLPSWLSGAHFESRVALEAVANAALVNLQCDIGLVHRLQDLPRSQISLLLVSLYHEPNRQCDSPAHMLYPVSAYVWHQQALAPAGPIWHGWQHECLGCRDRHLHCVPLLPTGVQHFVT